MSVLTLKFQLQKVWSSRQSEYVSLGGCVRVKVTFVVEAVNCIPKIEHEVKRKAFHERLLRYAMGVCQLCLGHDFGQRVAQEREHIAESALVPITGR